MEYEAKTMIDWQFADLIFDFWRRFAFIRRGRTSPRTSEFFNYVGFQAQGKLQFYTTKL